MYVFDEKDRGNGRKGRGAIATDKAPLFTTGTNFTACESKLGSAIRAQADMTNKPYLKALFLMVYGGAQASGIDLDAANTKSEIWDSLFVNNSHSGGLISIKSAIELHKCQFLNNAQLLFNPIGSVHLYDSKFTGPQITGFPIDTGNEWSMQASTFPVITWVSPNCPTWSLPQTPTPLASPTPAVTCPVIAPGVKSQEGRVIGDTGCLIVANCKFISISAQGDGGAIRAGAFVVQTWIHDCEFQEVSVTAQSGGSGSGRGGAIGTECATSEILRCCASQCRSAGTGKFAYFGGSTSVLSSRSATDCVIFQCAPPDSSTDFGTAGGAIDCGANGIRIALTNFTACQSLSAAICFRVQGLLHCSSIFVVGCRGRNCLDIAPVNYGQAVSGAADISDSFFVSNTIISYKQSQKDTTEAVVVARNAQTGVTLTSCVFADNTADLISIASFGSGGTFVVSDSRLRSTKPNPSSWITERDPPNQWGTNVVLPQLPENSQSVCRAVSLSTSEMTPASKASFTPSAHLSPSAPISPSVNAPSFLLGASRSVAVSLSFIPSKPLTPSTHAAFPVSAGFPISTTPALSSLKPSADWISPVLVPSFDFLHSGVYLVSREGTASAVVIATVPIAVTSLAETTLPESAILPASTFSPSLDFSATSAGVASDDFAASESAVSSAAIPATPLPESPVVVPSGALNPSSLNPGVSGGFERSSRLGSAPLVISASAEFAPPAPSAAVRPSTAPP
jgi:hypothetical protein